MCKFANNGVWVNVANYGPVIPLVLCKLFNNPLADSQLSVCQQVFNTLTFCWSILPNCGHQSINAKFALLAMHAVRTWRHRNRYIICVSGLNPRVRLGPHITFIVHTWELPRICRVTLVPLDNPKCHAGGNVCTSLALDDPSTWFENATLSSGTGYSRSSFQS